MPLTAEPLSLPLATITLDALPDAPPLQSRQLPRGMSVVADLVARASAME